MAKWGEIKCPRCAELEAKLERAEDFLRRLERF
jgi:phage FluMu protein Com